MAAPHVRSPVRPAESAGFEPPYPPGWFDRLIDWMEAAPGPTIAWAVGLLVVQTIYLVAVIWWNGTLPVGDIEPRRLFFVVVAPYLLGVRLYLDRVAWTALDEFRPALSVDEREFQRLRYELTTLPARTTWSVTGVALLLFIVNWVRAPDWLMRDYARSHLAALLSIGPFTLFTISIVVLSIARAVHQLQMVQRLHERATTIRLFRTKPLYAFSHVAAQTGMSLLLLIYYAAAVRTDVVLASAPLRLVLLAMMLTAVGCFVLPLRGMHRRIAAEKDRALAQTALRFESLTARLHDRFERGDLTDTDKLAAQLAGVITERDALSGVSTWPWEPSTMTAFVTTMVLPAIVWLVQRVLTRMGM